jgi:indole-3-glycerol phosphate synthase
MSDFLERMAFGSAERMRVARANESEAALLERARRSAEPLPLKLAGFDLIAELKLRSPAAGTLATQAFDASRQLDAYAAAGAAAVSVLTEPLEFEGSLEQLATAAARLRPHGLPVMRKDFLVDRYQVVEARAAGASGVLLIAAMVGDAVLEEMIAAANELGLFVLLEAFDASDLDRIARLALPQTGPAILVGVNSRNLRTLEVDRDRFRELAPALPAGLPAVAESGIDSVRDIEAVAELGFRLALVGSALMRDADVATTAAAFIAAGRRATRGQAACS